MKKKTVRGIKVIFLIVLAIVWFFIVVDMLIFFNYTQTESDCNQYQEYYRQSFLTNKGNCVNKAPSVVKDCLNYDGDICIEWINKYRLE